MRVGVAERRSVLIISSWADDRASLRTIFRNSPWQLREAITGGEGLVALRNDPHGIPVVICEHHLPDGDWKGLLAEVVEMPARPRLIVFSRLADERLWAEVLNLGAFDLLVGSPFEAEEVLRVAESAWLASAGKTHTSRASA